MLQAREITALGIALIIIGFALVFLSAMLSAKGKTDVKAGGIILVGAFPIVFGTDQSTVFWAIVIGLVLIVSYLFFSTGK